MGFALEHFDRLEHRLDTSDIDFDDFRLHPLSEPVLRCLRYMHDVEHHTVHAALVDLDRSELVELCDDHIPRRALGGDELTMTDSR